MDAEIAKIEDKEVKKNIVAIEISGGVVVGVECADPNTEIYIIDRDEEEIEEEVNLGTWSWPQTQPEYLLEEIEARIEQGT